MYALYSYLLWLAEVWKTGWDDVFSRARASWCLDSACCLVSHLLLSWASWCETTCQTLLTDLDDTRFVDVSNKSNVPVSFSTLYRWHALFVSLSVWVAATEDHRLGGLKDRNFLIVLEAGNSRLRCWLAGFLLDLPDLQMAAFFLCSYMVFPLCVHCRVSSSSQKISLMG
jgi:hypothetical protein